MASFSRIDHVHIFVPDQLQAEQWYHKVLGFKRVAGLDNWLTETGGPLTIENGGVHLALFAAERKNSTIVAFAVDAHNYQSWKTILSENGVAYTEMDHQEAWSIYFYDPYQNPYEITCYDYSDISQQNTPKA